MHHAPPPRVARGERAGGAAGIARAVSIICRADTVVVHMARRGGSRGTVVARTADRGLDEGRWRRGRRRRLRRSGRWWGHRWRSGRSADFEAGYPAPRPLR
eukprot:scaffold16627_cov57-Phaeocystis_antarctica.AAC.4